MTALGLINAAGKTGAIPTGVQFALKGMSAPSVGICSLFGLYMLGRSTVPVLDRTLPECIAYGLQRWCVQRDATWYFCLVCFEIVGSVAKILIKGQSQACEVGFFGRGCVLRM